MSWIVAKLPGDTFCLTGYDEKCLVIWFETFKESSNGAAD